MASKRITVSVPADIAIRIKQAAGDDRSISEWVTSAVRRTLEEEDTRRRFLAFCDAIEASASDERKASATFDQVTRGRKGTRKARASRRGKTAA